MMRSTKPTGHLKVIGHKFSAIFLKLFDVWEMQNFQAMLEGE